MSRGGGDFGLGKGVMEFGATDAEFQKTADRVEKRMERTVKIFGQTFTESQLSPEWIKQLEAAGAFATKAEEPINKVSRAVRGLSENSSRAEGIIRRFTSAMAGRELVNAFGAGLERMGKAAAEMATKMRLGEASTADLVEGVARGIPVLGHFIAAGRDIREAITGEKAYTEVVLANAKAQDERIAAVGRWLDAMKGLQRESEDLTTRLRRQPSAVFDITGIITGGERQAEDLSGKLRERFDKQFKEIADERKRLHQRLQDLEREATNQGRLTGAEGGESVELQPDPGIASNITAVRGQIEKVDEQARKLRASMEQVESLTRETIGRGIVTGVLQRFGVEFKGALDSAEAAMKRYIANLPQMQEETRRAIDGSISDWQRYQNAVRSFTIDLQKGLITQKTFDQIAGAAFWKNAQGAFDAYAARVKSTLAGLGASALQTFNFAPILNVADRLKQMFSDFGDQRRTATDGKREFQSRSVSLEGLGAGIQQAAFGGGDVAKQQLDVQKKTGIDTAKIVTILGEMKKQKPGPAIAG